MSFVLYHANCADGIAAMHLWKLSNPDEKFMAIKHGTQPSEEIKQANKLVFLDFTFTNPIMRELSQNASIIVYDHHLSAFDALKDIPYQGIVDTTQCASLIIWRLLYPKTPVQFWLKAIDAGDRWTWDQVPGAKEFMAFAWENGYISEEKIHELNDLDSISTIEDGRIICQTKTNLAQHAAKTMVPCYLGDKKVGLVVGCIRPLLSECGNIVCTENNKLDAAVIANYSITNQKWHLSFRSRNDVNCLKIFAQGPIVPRGHPQACGTQVDNLNDFKVIKDQ